MRFQDHLYVICQHVKGSVPSLQPLSGLVPKPKEILDSVLPHTLSGDQLSTLCQLLDSLCWIVDEKVHIQQLAGVSGVSYTIIYKFCLQDRINVSIVPDSPPRKLPQAPKRKWKILLFPLIVPLDWR